MPCSSSKVGWIGEGGPCTVGILAKGERDLTYYTDEYFQLCSDKCEGAI